jgi:hypothetical protein
MPLLSFICNNRDSSVETKHINGNKLVVVIDQSRSISYKDREKEIRPIVSSAFKQTYQYVLGPAEYLISNVTSETNVVPNRVSFPDEYPDAENLGGVSMMTETANWHTKRNQWIEQGVTTIYNSVLASKTTDTDIFGSLQALNMGAQSVASTDTLSVLFFSDMKQSTKSYELTTLLKNKDPEHFAKQESRRILKTLNLKKLGNKFHCDITIVRPDNFGSSSEVVRFWNQFFEEFGIKTVNWL